MRVALLRSNIIPLWIFLGCWYTMVYKPHAIQLTVVLILCCYCWLYDRSIISHWVNSFETERWHFVNCVYILRLSHKIIGYCGLFVFPSVFFPSPFAHIVLFEYFVFSFELSWRFNHFLAETWDQMKSLVSYKCRNTNVWFENHIVLLIKWLCGL